MSNGELLHIEPLELKFPCMISLHLKRSALEASGIFCSVQILLDPMVLVLLCFTFFI